jgi:hypothetical protein
MSTEDTIEINGDTYTVRELTMEEGLPLFEKKENAKSFNAMIIRAATHKNGKQMDEDEPVTFGVAMKLMPIVFRINGLSGNA